MEAGKIQVRWKPESMEKNMKISKKCRYGLRALIDLSVNSGSEHVVLGTIAERNGISPQYLEQVFASLRRAGIVKGIKGSQGGYRLNVDPEDLTVSRILEVLDGSYEIEEEEVPDVTEQKRQRTVRHSAKILLLCVMFL